MLSDTVRICMDTGSTAQGGGGSFKNRKVNHGWQREATDGSKGD